ncbi:hypothetical protein CIK05_05975 [Bdellovibrio sp. qaytius]|nr:hypothetical protein CIK05_05975 [Bdellovibrio sp. qaytius]
MNKTPNKGMKMVNKFIIASILISTGFACAEKSYRSAESSQPAAAASTNSQSYERSTASTTEPSSTEVKDVDNTAMNKRDAENTTLTPMDQVEGSKADIELTRKIREALTDSDSLSIQAQNIKIITLKGITTLRGPVHTKAEKRKIEQLAKSAGAKKIKNHLEVTTKTE